MPDAIIRGLSARKRRPPQNLGAWDCPTCGSTNTGRIEDGCPRCLAGNDARRKGQAPVQRPEPAAVAAAVAAAVGAPVVSPALQSIEGYHSAIARLLDGDGAEGEDDSPDITEAQHAYQVFRDSVKRIAVKPEELVRMAFMGGVVWAREVGGSVPDGITSRSGRSPAGQAVEPAAAAAVDPPDAATGAGATGTGEGARLGTHNGVAGPYTEVDDRTQATIIAALAFYRDNQLAYGEADGQLSADEVNDLIDQLLPAAEAGEESQ